MTAHNLFAHRNADTECRETFEWLTDVRLSRNGTDRARSKLRAYPRQTYSYDIVSGPHGDKAWLDALRRAETLVVPLWCHGFQRPDTAATAGLAAADRLLVQLTEQGAGLLSSADAFTWQPGYYFAAPAALGRPVADTRSITHIRAVGGLAQRTAVSFRLLPPFRELVAPYTGPAIGGVPLLDPFTQAWSEPAEQADANANSFDNGHLDLHEVRYFKRSHTLTLKLRSRSEILAFRQLLFSLDGRFSPLYWTFPGEVLPSLWRLASDTVEISYARPNRATCQLSLMELSE